MTKKLYRPGKDELETLRPMATKNGAVSEEKWIADNIRATSKLLKNEPKRYRGYGPYWWILKKIMLAHGITDFGDHVDIEWADLCDYGNDFHNLLAAWMYQDIAFENGLIYSNAHNVAFEPEAEGMEHDVAEYILADDEMELLAVQTSLQ